MDQQPKGQQKKSKTAIEKLFEGYDFSQLYPFEFVDKGGPVGRELN